MNPLDIFLPILINPLINILLALYHLALLAHLPGPFGWAIIFLTLLIRLVVYPLMATQISSQRKMAEIKPHLSELKKKHGSNPQKHREEQTKLYQEYGINPAGGCVPLLVQFPILIGLYNVFFSILSQPVGKALDHLNSVAYAPWLRLDHLDETFLGLNLAQSPAHFGPLNPLILIPIFTALLQFVLAKMAQITAAPGVSKDKKAKEEMSFEEALASSQGSMVYLFPIITGYFAYSFPFGLALYWNVANIFAIIQQYLIAGPGGLSSWLPKRIQSK